MNDTDKAQLKAVKAQAKELKAEGDGMMKKSHYADASERYIEATKLITKQPSDAIRNKLRPWLPVLLSLEATCHLKTGAWKVCVDVATRAMVAGKQDDPKLLFCRAQALENLGDLEKAAQDGEKAHEIDGSGAYHDAALLAHRCNVLRLGVLKGPKPRPQDFKIDSVLGEGNYTKVLKGVSILTQETFAIKTVTFAQIEKTERRHKNVKNELLMEREVLAKMNHPNVVHLYHTFKDANSLYYLFEYCDDAKELFHVLCTGEDTRKEFMVRSVDESQAADYLAQIVIALEYIHGEGVVHRDMKPENIMVRPNGSIFLIDFGTAKNLIDTEHNGPEFVGTPEYMSPEAVESQNVGPEGDLWALGCMAYQMLSGQNAFQGGSQYMTFLRQKRGEYATCSWWSKEATDFIASLLLIDPTKRLGSGGKYQNLKNHPFLKAAVERHQAAGAEHPSVPRTEEEEGLHRILDAVVSSDFTMLKSAKLYELPLRLQCLLQHKLSERQLMSNPEIMRLFYPTRDEAMFRRASVVEPYERRYLGMSVYEENKFTKAFSFVHVNVQRKRVDGETTAMLKRTVAAINRIYPRPRFVALSGSTRVCSSTADQDEEALTKYRKTLRLLAPNIAVVTVPGASDFPNGVPDQSSLETFRNTYGADFYSFWIGRIMYVVLNSPLMLVDSTSSVLSSSYIAKERTKQSEWFEREVYVGRTRGAQVCVLMSNPLFLKKPEESREDDDVLPKKIAGPIIDTLRLSWGKYVFSSHPTRNGKGIHRGSTTSYEECDVRSYTTSELRGGPEESGEQGGDAATIVGGVRLVRVFESFAKPEFWRINEMPSSIDLDLKTNEPDEDTGSVVPSTAQSNAESTWMSTPTGGETKISRPEVSSRAAPITPAAPTASPASPTVAGKEEDGESSDDDELVIEDVTEEVDK